MTRFTSQEQALMSGDPRDVLDVRVYRFLKRNPGQHQRDRIMDCCGFSDPKREPVLAYVAFANSVIRLNARLRRFGVAIVRGPHENYCLREIGEGR